MKIFFICLMLTAAVVIETVSKDKNNKNYKIICYWASWSYENSGDGQFTIENIDPNLCTHLIYAFAKLDKNKIEFFASNSDVELDLYEKFNDLKNKNPHLTTMISIGGWNEKSRKYSEMAKNRAARKLFIESVLNFLQAHKFDGLEIDWEYPGFINQNEICPNSDDKENFALLIKELYYAFQQKGYVLSASVSGEKEKIDISYDVPTLSKYLNFISVAAYDFHGSWEKETGANAPLYPKSNANEIDLENTVDYAINYWLMNGADPKKIVLGIPFYGRSWTLSGGDNGYKSQTIGPGNPGQYTNSPGVLNYNEICQMLNQEDWTIIRDHRFKVPYMVNGNQWISYDDVESIKEKVGFLKSKGLAGAMVWSIDCDDFRGNCDSGTYPLLKTIANTLIKGNNGNNYEDNKTSNDESKKLSQKQSPEGNWFKYGEENFSKCGPKAPLRNGKIATCDPNNGGCCSKWGYCGEGPEYCECEECTDYRIKSP